MKLSGRRRDDQVEPNLTPMIDVVFLLLLFFILSTTFDKEVQLKVELPEARAEQPDRSEEVVEAVIAPDGRFFLGGQEVRNTSVETLKQALEKAVPDPETPIVINADRTTQYESVIRLMDAATQVGRTKLRFAVDYDAQQ